jgi:hypothetical protein
MRVKILILFIAISFCIKPFKSIAQVNVQDSLALVDYYDSTYGVAPWQFGQSWDLKAPVNTWLGVGVSNNRVISIKLWGGGNGAGAYIPSSFGNLTALQRIEFLDYSLSSNLPASFANLVNLSSIYFHAVFGFTPRTFPVALTYAPNVKSISMEDNYLDSIPSTFGNMKKLVTLDLFQNSLSGTIPSSINTLDSLKSMDISYNYYTFKGIEPFVNDYIASHKTYSLVYASQNNISIHRYDNKLAVSAGGTLSNNTFKWYKDSALVATITGDSTYVPADTGRYYVAISNSIATDLTLYGDEITLHYIMPASEVSATQNITGTSPVNITDGIFEIAKLQPTAGANQLTGSITALVNVDASVTTFHKQPYVQRHYDITPAVNADNAQAIVTLYFTQNDFDNYNDYVTTNNLSLPLLPTGGIDNGNIRITQFHGNFAGSSRPENYSNPNVVLIVPVVTWDNTNQWWTLTFSVTGFSGFFLSTANSVLPLILLNFDGQTEKNNVNLHWATSEEINTSQFIVERSNEIAFSDIGTINAQSSAGVYQYNFTDNNPLQGINFYRLKMIDKDNHFTYSNIIKINFESDIRGIKIYPNPVKSLLNIKITSDKVENIVLKITDASGKSIKQILIQTNVGITPVFINVAELTNGVYYLNGQINNRSEKVSFVKK